MRTVRKQKDKVNEEIHILWLGNGQCSITAFLMQDIFGGKVYGILRPGGNHHCFIEADGCVSDLTSEQFGDEVLDYSNCPKQLRETRLAKEEKRLRYEHLRTQLLNKCPFIPVGNEQDSRICADI